MEKQGQSVRLNGVEDEVNPQLQTNMKADGSEDGYPDEYVDELIVRLKKELEEAKSDADFVKAVKEILTSQAAPKLVETVMAPLTRTRELEAQANVESSKVYARASFTGNIFFIVALVCCLTFLGIVIAMLRTDKELLLPVLSALISLIAGAGGGYVFGRQSVPK